MSTYLAESFSSTFVVNSSMMANRPCNATTEAAASVHNSTSYIFVQSRRLLRSDRRNAHTSKHADVVAVNKQIAVTVNTYVLHSTTTELIGTVHAVICVQNIRINLTHFVFVCPFEFFVRKHSFKRIYFPAIYMKSRVVCLSWTFFTFVLNALR